MRNRWTAVRAWVAMAALVGRARGPPVGAPSWNTGIVLRTGLSVAAFACLVTALLVRTER